MTGSRSLQNEAVFERIDEHALSKYRQYFSEASPQAPARGPVEIDYWSISYRLAFRERSVFVKIPKAERRQSDIASVAADPRALESARTEFDGFAQIYGIADWPEGCATVRPLEYIPSFNTIVTEFVPSEDLYRQCRRAAIRNRLGWSPSSGSVHQSLVRCGAWLRHFQRSGHCGETVRVSGEQLMADIGIWGREIKRQCVRPARVDAVLARLERCRWSHELPKARTCEGFEVRNIIVDGGGAIRLVDPGAVSWASGIEDAAHFLVSLTLLYWGTPALWLGIPMARAYRESFLRGWAPADLHVEPAAIAWFETRELFRQWREACRVVSSKPYSPAIRRFCRAVYVDPFLLNRIEHAAAEACR